MYEQRGALVPRDRAGHHFPDPLRVILEDGVPLVVPDLLDHHLLGGLGGDSSEGPHVDRLSANHGVDLAADPIDPDNDVSGLVMRLPHGGKHGCFEIGKHAFLLDASVTTDRVDNPE